MATILHSYLIQFAGIASVGFAFVSGSQAADRTDPVNVVRLSTAGQPVKAQVGPDGAIHLLLDSSDGPRYVKSLDGGRNFSEPIPVVDAAAQRPGLTFSGSDLAVGREGRVYVVMSNNAWKLKLPQEEWSLYFASLSPGASAFSPVRNLNRKPSEGFALAADDRGTVTATFLSDKLYAMVSRDDGQTFTASAEIDPAWNPCNCCTTSAAYGADGKLAVIYREETNDERDMFVVLWDQRPGAKPSRSRMSMTPWKLAACPMTYFTISRTKTGYVAAWPTKGKVHFARLYQDGRVLSPGEVKTPGTTGMRNNVLAISASNGDTLIGWKNKNVLGWQLYGENGKTKGSPGSTDSPGSGAAGVALQDGTFLLFP